MINLVDDGSGGRRKKAVVGGGDGNRRWPAIGVAVATKVSKKDLSKVYDDNKCFSTKS